MMRFLIILLFGFEISFAEEIPNIYLPVRAAGMGEAFTSVANDEGALFTNPAGIARVRKARSRNSVHITKFPNIIVGANTASKSFYEGFNSAQDKNVSEIVNSSDSIGDKPFWARASIFPVTLFDVSRGNPMAIGLLSDTRLKAVVEKANADEARVEAVSDQAIFLTAAYTNQTNRFSVGLQVRPTVRNAYEGKFPSSELIDKDALKKRMDRDSNKLQGLGVDFGMLYTVADFWFPTVGVSVMNLPTGCKGDYLNPFTEKRESVCGTKFAGSVGYDDALSIVDPTDVRVGFSIIPRLTRKMNLRLSLDAHHVVLTDGTNFYGLQGIEVNKLIHAGAEFFFGNPLLIPPFSLRAGYSQGFATAGASANLGFFSLEAAVYGRDVSSGSSPLEDRRILGSLTFDF